MKRLPIYFFPSLLFFLFSTFFSFAQEKATIYGMMKDSLGNPLPGINIQAEGDSTGTVSDANGKYRLKVPVNKSVTIIYSCIGFRKEKYTTRFFSGQSREINKVMKEATREFGGVTIEDRQDRLSNITRIDPKTIELLPNPAGSFEAVLKTLPGVSSNNELSSQYNVRGGNYDENLVYVNDIEVYRPFLIHSSQQEGLSFVNSDLVSSILFSAGGFDARYGDKMSSVLDIRYKKPEKMHGSGSLSLLGGSAHLEGSSRNHIWTYLAGIRQKSNQYVLSGLPTKGDYRPSFTDIQSYVTYNPDEKFEFAFLGNISRNSFLLIPQTRETDFGTINEALRLTVYFDGREADRYETYMGAFSTTYKPDNNLRMKFIASSYKTYESETFDTEGQYYIDELERDIGKSNFGDVAFNLGVGTYLNHARNYLDAFVNNIEHKGYYTRGKNYLQWGGRLQNEIIHDRLTEWKMIDSSGYNLPHPDDSIGYAFPSSRPVQDILLQDVVKNSTDLSSDRYSAYIQNTSTLSDSSNMSLTTGIRINYWDLNNQFIISPRAAYSFRPKWKKDFVFRLSSGYYYQPPFYRELRDLEGNIHKDIRAQRSIHFVTGGDYSFRAWGRPFKYVTEIYYKHLDNIIPYKIDNVRIRYLANNNAHGYAAGIDMRINGEFVTGLESWASLSVMQTQEDIEGDYYYDYYNKSGEQIIKGYTLDNIPTDSVRHEPGYIPRPTDQRINFGLFFQDYLPKYPTYKMHLNLLFGSGLPFGPPGYEKYRDVLRIPPYRRADIGFSKEIIGEHVKIKPASGLLKNLNSLWISAEIFNLLGVSNTVSYIWVADVTGRQYAVPNYLTKRQLNIRMTARF